MTFDELWRMNLDRRSDSELAGCNQDDSAPEEVDIAEVDRLIEWLENNS